MIIYKITNIIDNKVYIGQTVKTLDSRWKIHIKNSNGNCQYYLYRAMRLHGVNNFKREIIEECKTKEELYEREIYWIAHYKSNNPNFGYNMTEGGGGTIGKRHSSITIEKMRKAKLGKIPWNKNKTKETDERIKQYAEVVSRSSKGKIPWNKGLTAEKHQSIVKQARTQTGVGKKRKVDYFINKEEQNARV